MNKLTGWEIGGKLEYLLDKELQGSSELAEYSKVNPLISITNSKAKFVIIKKFAGQQIDGETNIIDLPDFEGGDFYPLSFNVLVIVWLNNYVFETARFRLPNSLEFSKIEINEDETIIIHHSKGFTSTNTNELIEKQGRLIKKQGMLFYGDNRTEEELTNRFDSLCNEIFVPEKIEKHPEKSISNEFFGEFNFNDELDLYEVNYNGVMYSFYNTNLEQLIDNISNTEKLIPLIETLKNKMVDEMIVLKNNDWLQEDEEHISILKFKKEMKLYSIVIYDGGSIELYFQDNDMFYGHDIITYLDANHNYISSELFG